MAQVSVIVPTYRSWDALWNCLSALRLQACPPHEIVIVNNDPGDGCPFTALLRHNEVIVDEWVVGSYAARNRGILVSACELIAFTDSDCIPDQNWLGSAVAVFESHPEIDRVAGSINLFRPKCGRWVVWRFETIAEFGQAQAARQGLARTANLIVRRRVIDQIGAFDSDVNSGGDYEWSRRAESSGFRMLYCERASVRHPARGTLGQLIQKRQRLLGGRYVRARRKQRYMRFIAQNVSPPVSRARTWIEDGAGAADVALAFCVLWAVKLATVPELVRLIFGKLPER